MDAHDPITRLNAALEDRYRIERELGEGGMATVYLARDLKHDREVALKVLKPELAAVVGADRFLAEIKTTANLQHPHILPLHDSGEADGLLYYVMPYVKGESLRQRLDREHQLPVDDALRIATNIAEALDYAHAQGVVHRDIKPANILLQSGKPVISDFGIALAVDAAGGGRLTETGLSLGTPHYMSPEQATGDLHVGPAADIYALGCVLYEMLVGEPPFTGSTPQAVLGRIITGETPSATAERALVPRHVDAAIRRALEKLPADRFQRASDIPRALADPAFHHGEPTETRPRRGVSWLIPSLAGMLLALALVWLWTGTRADAPGRPERFVIPFEQEMAPRGGGDEWAVFPDGSTLVYTTSSSELLQLRRLTDSHSTSLPGTEGEGVLQHGSISPDGSEVVYRTEGEIHVVSLTGAGSRMLMRGRSAGWGDDGYVYVTTDDGLDRVPAEGGEPEPVTRLGEGEVIHRFTDAVPGGILIDVLRGDGGDVEFVELSSFERTLLVPNAGQGQALETGYLVYTMDNALTADVFDVEARRVAGRPLTLQTGVGRFFISDDGRLFYREAGGGPGPLEFVWMSRMGEARPLNNQAFAMRTVNVGWSLSPDDSEIAFTRWMEGSWDIWTMEVSSGELRRLTNDPAREYPPRWHPDGLQVGFMSSRADSVADPFGFYTVPRDGGQAPRLLFGDEQGAFGVWSPDSRWLVLRTTTGPQGDFVAARDILAIRPGLDSVPRPLAASAEAEETQPAISRDGRWLALVSDETGRFEVYVQPFPDADGMRWPVSLDGGSAPLWAKHGDELYFIRPETRELVSVRYEATPSGFRPISRDVLFVLPPDIDIDRNYQYDISSDGQRFLMARSPADDPPQALPRIFVIDHWAQEVERRLSR